MQVDRDALHEPSMLEKMRAKVQDRRRPKLAEFSFVLSDFKKLNRDDAPRGLVYGGVDEGPNSYFYKKVMAKCDLTSNHFVSLKEKFNPQVVLNEKKRHTNMLRVAGEDEEEVVQINSEIVNGYDGFSGVHDNLIWNPANGNMIYTLHNKVIIEMTKTRQQKVLPLSSVRLSCLA